MRLCTTASVNGIRSHRIALTRCAWRIYVGVHAEVADIVCGTGVDEIATEDHYISCVEREGHLLTTLVKRVNDQVSAVL